MNIGVDIRAAKWYRGTGIGTYTHQLIKAFNNIDSFNSYSLYCADKNIDIQLNYNFKLENMKEIPSQSFWDSMNISTNILDPSLSLYHVPQNGVGLPEKKETPLIITLHDTIPIHMPETVGDRYLKIFNENMTNIVNSCDGIITVSNYSKEDIAKDFNFPKEKIFVTYLASEEIYRPMDKKYCNDLLNEYYSIPSNYILYVGGFSPRKNISGLIKSFSKIHKKLPQNMKLLIVGNKGISYSIYKSLSESLNISDKVIFPGFIPMEHMPHLYNGASLLVYPSFYEGFGLPPVEAMACGIPVIASNITSIPEILGESALLFHPEDLDTLSEMILNCVLDNRLRLSLIENGFKKAHSLSWNKTAEDTLKIYEKIISTCHM